MGGPEQPALLLLVLSFVPSACQGGFFPHLPPVLRLTLESRLVTSPLSTPDQPAEREALGSSARPVQGRVVVLWPRWRISPARQELDTKHERRRETSRAAECSPRCQCQLSEIYLRHRSQRNDSGAVFFSSVLLVRAMLGLNGWLGNKSSCPECQSGRQPWHCLTPFSPASPPSLFTLFPLSLLQS